MTTQNTNNRLSSKILDNDEEALEGLQTLSDYNPQREEAKIETLQVAQAEMVKLQKLEAKLKAEYRDAIEAAREAEWKFHNGVLEAKNAVVAQFGADSSQVKKVGRKRKSERKRTSRRKKAA